MDIERIYLEWLRGKSLRAIAKSSGVKHSTIWVHLRANYGFDATNVAILSLARSLAQDYPDTSDAELLEYAATCLNNPEETKHRSKHSLRQLTRYQVAHKADTLDSLAYSYDDPIGGCEQPLRLPFVELLVSSIATILFSYGKQVDLAGTPVT